MARNSADISWKSGRSPDDMKKLFARLDQALNRHLRAAMETAVLIIESTAKKLAPVGEGRLRSDIASDVRQIANHVIVGVLGSNVEYAPYQEFGTRFMSANSYLQPAIQMHIDRVIDLLQEGVDRAVREVS